MTVGLRSYPEYKDSGLPWLGQVPAHWSIVRTKRLFRLSVDKSPVQHGMELLSIYTHIGVRPRKELEQRGNKATTTDGYWIVKKGDIIVNKLLAWMGAVGVSHYEGVTSPAYDILRPVRSLKPDFYHYLFRTNTYLQQFKSRSRGIMEMRLRLYFDQLGQIPVVLPPEHEQGAIVRFLDAYSRLMTRFIRNRRRLIQLLNEQKQAIINRAVTRGLDPHVPLKPSGIDWLEDVPEHWVVKPLKRWVSINELVLPESTDPDYTFQYLEIGCVGTGFLVAKPAQLRFADAPSRARRVLRRGDTIISTVRTYLRAIYFVTENADNLVASTGFAALTPEPGIVPEFLAIALQSASFIERVTAHSIGIAYPAISETRLGAFPVAIPPSTDDQSAIVDYVRYETEALDKGIMMAQREIDLIREYRTRLIADVVTGKVDVRHLAPSPEVMAAEAAPEDLDESLDDETPGEDDLELAEEVTDADD
jgi:type I restriction enzyme S subunit